MSRPQQSNKDRDERLSNSQLDDRQFTDAQFLAYLNTASLKFLKEGQLTFSLNIPPSAVDDALDLRFLSRNPLPLLVSIQIHPGYKKRLDSDNKRLELLMGGIDGYDELDG